MNKERELTAMGQETLQPLSPSQREGNEAAVRVYQGDVWPDGNEYLQGRGITDETATTFRLGVVSNPQPGHERYRGKLAIPYLHPHGYPLSIRFRCIEKHVCAGHPKYLGMPGEHARMFHTPAIFGAVNEIHVTEGEFDAIILNQLGYPAVAMPGATNWAPRHRVMLAGFSHVWVWGDGDDAGADFVNSVQRSLRQARGIPVGKGNDVTDLFLAGGADAIASRLDRVKETMLIA